MWPPATITSAVYLDLPPECEEGGVRLVGGETPRLGRLEMCVDGVWSAVCNDGWTEHNQNNAVVCRELGFDTSRKISKILRGIHYMMLLILMAHIP